MAVPAPEIPPPPIVAETRNDGSVIAAWLIAAALLIGGLALLFARRRRRRTALLYHDADRAPAVEAAPVVVTGEPRLEMLIRPVRAGVNAADAVVEFVLTVDNRGTAPAKDVRISTWMVAAGSQSSELESLLIEHPAQSSLPRVDPGDAQRIERTVTLPIAAIKADSLLPIVVAEARYRLVDGTERRTSARVAVGVPLDGELAHFDVENPSGMHENVEARQL